MSYNMMILNDHQLQAIHFFLRDTKMSCEDILKSF